jgi:hypothetical protein
MMVMVRTLVESGRFAMRDRLADLVHVHGRLGRDAAVGLAHPKGLLAAPFRLSGFSRYPRRAGLITTDKSIQASSFAGRRPPWAASVQLKNRNSLT